VADLTYSPLSVEVRRNEGQGLYQFGVNLNGVFVVFAARKLGGVDDDLRRAAESLQSPPAEQPQQPTQTPADATTQQPQQPAEQTPEG
jgi:hypothetical protein